MANVKESGIGRIVEVGRYGGGASPFGALDMCGNVWEWTASAALNYSDPSEVLAPGMVIRGGAYDVPREHATATYRGIVQPEKGYPKTGFRCARDVR
jgi:formylglycine-generating enzyme required for sulfatase activity